jgi:hypothetical protein
VIRAVGDRRTTPARVLVAIGAHLSLPGRGELLRLVNLLERGCRRELELWGYDHAFTGPDLPDLQRDVPVRLGARTVYLDIYCPAAGSTSNSTVPGGTPRRPTGSGIPAGTRNSPRWASWWCGSPTSSWSGTRNGCGRRSVPSWRPGSPG